MSQQPNDARSYLLQDLNPAQREAVEHDDRPLLIVAGAGTGKTKTLVHRVARIIADGADPSRILVMTFTRRAASEMLRRTDAVLQGRSANAAVEPISQRVWGGTFHAVATRLLRMYGKHVGLEPGFTIHDRSDSEDLMDIIRTELNLAKTVVRFPKKGTCMAIYSHCVNSRNPINDVLRDHFPWCADFQDELKLLFRKYTDRKEEHSVLDYDDLLVFLRALLLDEAAGPRIRARFQHVLVDEYQDTNKLQSEILQGFSPDGHGVTVVGDDAQSIYSFRAATVRNILDFPLQFSGATVIKLEQNYRSTPPILEVTNHVIAESTERFEKQLWTQRKGSVTPSLVTCEDENEQAEYVVRRILERRESGIQLKNQAVLFRASHHSIVLEARLAQANIPFVKYGGLKFLEAAHVKDLMSFLRLVENPRDVIAGTRVLSLLPGIGGKKARQLLSTLEAKGWKFEVWLTAKPPEVCREQWPGFVALVNSLQDCQLNVASQIERIRAFYAPILEEKYDNASVRLRDLEQLEQIASRYEDRAAMLSEITLDPPNSTEDLAADPLLDEDYLILSTIHSAKGLEWDSVYLIHASDGNIPSDMATKDPEQVEEERRLFYVALTRAKNDLHVCFPLRYYQGYRGNMRDAYGFAQLTRFVTPKVKSHFQISTAYSSFRTDSGISVKGRQKKIRKNMKSMWS